MSRDSLTEAVELLVNKSHTHVEIKYHDARRDRRTPFWRKPTRESTHGQIDSRKHPVGGAYYDED